MEAAQGPIQWREKRMRNFGLKKLDGKIGLKNGGALNKNPQIVSYDIGIKQNKYCSFYLFY